MDAGQCDQCQQPSLLPACNLPLLAGAYAYAAAILITDLTFDLGGGGKLAAVGYYDTLLRSSAFTVTAGGLTTSLLTLEIHWATSSSHTREGSLYFGLAVLQASCIAIYAVFCVPQYAKIVVGRASEFKLRWVATGHGLILTLVVAAICAIGASSAAACRCP